MMDFSGSAGATSTFDCIPAGFIAFAVLTVKGIKASASGGGYLDCELTIDRDQPYAGRKVFEMIGDPQNAGNSEAYRQMGTVAITRILEAGRGAGPNNPAGYQITAYEQLSGLRVAVKLKVEEGTNGHNDKNKVAEWLTPNPASGSGNKGWVKLAAGDHGIAAKAAPAAASGFGGFAPGPHTASAFGNAGGQAVAATGFGTAAANAATSASAATSTGSGFATTTPATTPSPSDPGATPGWLAQAAG